MSIPNLIHKIKGKTGIDRTSILFLFIIAGVGIGSFGLGRLSVGPNVNEKTSDNISIIQTANNSANESSLNNNTSTVQSMVSSEKRYVASKNGKMYYTSGCSGAKRIKPVNQVWFGTKEDAEKSGFVLSTTCK